MKIILMRHGEQLYSYNAQGQKLVCGVDAPLTDLGRQQMRELRQELDRQGIKLDVIYKSPLLRVEQSANELVEGQATPVYEVDGLKETFPNSAEGKTYKELEERGGDIYVNPFDKTQETLDHLVGRSRAALESILLDARKFGYSSMGIVGHGDPLCALQWCIRNEDLPSSYAEMKRDFYPQKGEAYEYMIGPNLRIEGEGKVITTKAAIQTMEGFRNSNKELE